MLNVVMLNVVMLNVIMLNVVMLNVVMLNVVMLNVVILNVIMLNVVAPFRISSKNTIPVENFVRWMRLVKPLDFQTGLNILRMQTPSDTLLSLQGRQLKTFFTVVIYPTQ